MKDVRLVSVRTRCVWFNYRECVELLYGNRFRLQLKKGYLRSTILCGSET